MATNVLTAGNDTVAPTQGTSKSYWGKSYDGAAGTDTLYFSGDTYAGYAGNFSLTADASGVVTMSTGSGSCTFVNFEAIKFSNLTINLGTSANDTITGGTKADTFLFGLGGDDTIDGGLGADRMMGGAGNDIYMVDNAGDTVVEAVNDGTDTVKSSVAISALAANVDNLILNGTAAINGTGNSLDNVITGNSANNILTGGGGTDTVVYSGNRANYTVITSDGINGTISGADGTDTLNAIAILQFADGIVSLMSFKPSGGGGGGGGNTATSGADSLTGTAGADSIDGLGGDDTINGLAGDDTLTGGAGNDTLIGGGGSDTAVYSGAKASYTVTTSDGISGTISGADGTDTLTNITSLSFLDGTVTLASFIPAGGGGGGGTGGGTGGGATSGPDKLTGTAGKDSLYGLAGNDVLDGKGGVDLMDGGAGDDIYYVDSVYDYVREFIDNGHDTICSSVSITGLRLFVEDLKLIGTAAKGTGNSAANLLTGNASENQLSGLGGNDTLNGAAGADRLTGGAGKDVLSGGSGRDVFDFNALSESKVGALRDKITGFMHGVDRIDLSTLDANGSAAGNGAFLLQYGKGLAFTGLKGLVHYAWQGASTLVEGDVNGDRKADFQIELAGHVSLTKADFIL